MATSRGCSGSSKSLPSRFLIPTEDWSQFLIIWMNKIWVMAGVTYGAVLTWRNFRAWPKLAPKSKQPQAIAICKGCQAAKKHPNCECAFYRGITDVCRELNWCTIGPSSPSLFSLKRAGELCLQGTLRYEPPPGERVAKYWDKLQASVVTAPSVNIFKKRLEEVVDRSFSPLTEISSGPFLPL